MAYISYHLMQPIHTTTCDLSADGDPNLCNVRIYIDFLRTAENLVIDMSPDKAKRLIDELRQAITDAKS